MQPEFFFFWLILGQVNCIRAAVQAVSNARERRGQDGGTGIMQKCSVVPPQLRVG